MRRLGVAPKPKAPRAGVVPCCPEHIPFEALGFLCLADCISYIDHLARRGTKLAKTVRFPPEKVAGVPGAARIVAVLCPRCSARPGAMCDACSGWGWGLRIYRARGAT